MEHNQHTWTNQWDRRVCQICTAFELFNPVEEEEENVKPAKGSGKRSGKSVSGEGQDKGTTGQETTNVGADQSISE